MRRAARRDDSDKACVDAARAMGVHMEPLSAPGVPDYAWAFGGRVGWMEVKRPKAKGEKASKMTTAQVKFHQRWERAGVRIPVVETPDEVRGYFAWEEFRTYRDFPWDGYTAEERDRELAVTAFQPPGAPPPTARRAHAASPARPGGSPRGTPDPSD